jgi:hypothetical protein
MGGKADPLVGEQLRHVAEVAGRRDVLLPLPPVACEPWRGLREPWLPVIRGCRQQPGGVSAPGLARPLRAAFRSTITEWRKYAFDLRIKKAEIPRQPGCGGD